MTSRVWRLIVVAIGLAKTRFLLRTVGFATTISLMNQIPDLWSTTIPDHRWVSEVEWAAHRVGGSCLDRSVLLWFLMRLHGLDPALRIGVARAGEAIDGHAWVELGGHVVNDAPDVGSRFAVFNEDPTDLVFR